MIKQITLFLAGIFILGWLGAQTNVSAGKVFGTWKKANSPYKVQGQIYVPKDSTFKIEAGVKVEFQGAYTLHVWGSLQTFGKPNDTVVFTPANKTTGWQGILIHNRASVKDSILLQFTNVECAYAVWN